MVHRAQAHNEYTSVIRFAKVGSHGLVAPTYTCIPYIVGVLILSRGQQPSKIAYKIFKRFLRFERFLRFVILQMLHFRFFKISRFLEDLEISGIFQDF